MAKNQTYRAFVARPSHVLDLNGELLDSELVLADLASEVRDISAYATYVVRNDENLGDELARVTATALPRLAVRLAFPCLIFLRLGERAGHVKRNWFNTTLFRRTVHGRSEPRPRMVAALST